MITVTKLKAPKNPTILSDRDKANLWKQRFFEAQAAAEEHLMNLGGWPAIESWIEANSSITAKLLESREPTPKNRPAHFVSRLIDQLKCYDSQINSSHNLQSTLFTITNSDCGILRYRKVAAAAKVKLSFDSPCEYCTKLNCKILEKYSGATAQIEFREGGCQWKVTTRDHQKQTVDAVR